MRNRVLILIVVNALGYFVLTRVFLHETTDPPIGGSVSIERHRNGSATLTFDGHEETVPNDEVVKGAVNLLSKPRTVGWRRVIRYQILLFLVSLSLLFIIPYRMRSA